jgi:hypothetical protein
MQNNPIKKYYWGIGLENETYLQIHEDFSVHGQFIKEKMGRERYSIDYLKCYKEGVLNRILSSTFENEKSYFVSRMMNSHSLEKLDTNYEHKTILSAPPLKDNPKYSGESILELFLKNQPHQIKSMLTQKDNPMGCVLFDGDTVEFVTKYFENRIVDETVQELKASKQLFLDALNNSGIFSNKLSYPAYNFGINMFMSNQNNLVLFNNGTFHFHFTLPTSTIDSKIEDYQAFDEMHKKAIYLLQWVEPLFITTLGSPDIFAAATSIKPTGDLFAGGSMRNAMSRYTGIGTYHDSMPKGKVLTYPVDEFRKLLKFKKEDCIWWRDQIEQNMSYQLLNDLGLDFNREKLYQSGFEFRSFDEFPITHLTAVLQAIVLVCEHACHLNDVSWSHDHLSWNNMVYRSLRDGYETTIDPSEIAEVLLVFGISESEKSKFSNCQLLSDFFFKLLEVLFSKYVSENSIIDSLLGSPMESAPSWENFNQYQFEQHLKQLSPIE